MSEPMSERELEEVEKKGKEATDWASRVLPASLGYSEARGYARAYAEDTNILLTEVRRSHAENAELRDKVRELEGEEVIEHPIVLKVSLACAENQRDYYYQMWQQQTTELRGKVAAYEDVLGHYGHLDEARAALSPKQAEEEGGI